MSVYIPSKDHKNLQVFADSLPLSFNLLALNFHCLLSNHYLALWAAMSIIVIKLNTPSL